RWPRDWSSDVCSSDLSLTLKYDDGQKPADQLLREPRVIDQVGGLLSVIVLQGEGSDPLHQHHEERFGPIAANRLQAGSDIRLERSEERRVGKECTYRI